MTNPVPTPAEALLHDALACLSTEHEMRDPTHDQTVEPPPIGTGGYCWACEILWRGHSSRTAADLRLDGIRAATEALRKGQWTEDFGIINRACLDIFFYLDESDETIAAAYRDAKP